MNYEPLHTIQDTGVDKKTEIDLKDSRISLNSTYSSDSIAKNRIPRKLKKTFYYSLLLLLTAIILLIVGIEESVRNERFSDGMAFYILSFIVFIPGGYYVYQFFKAKITSDVEDRREILQSIPEL
jgi:hypothetical protein